MFHKIAILGPGLLGASLMQAVRQRGLAGHIATWSRRAETRARCAGRPWCDSVHETPAACVSGADLVVACVPVDKIGESLAAAATALAPGVLVTDVGSTKASVCREALTVLPASAVFIGSHPMAGSEKSGLEHATPALFEGRVCFITPPRIPAPDKLAALGQFWQALGMVTVEVAPEEHDAIVAHTSHLPHFAAAALSVALHRCPAAWRDFSGPGLRDTTRVAAGDPGLWRAVAKDNSKELLLALDSLQAELGTVRAALAAGDFDAVQTFLQCAKTWRDGMGAPPRSAPAPVAG
ncbi:MAG: prephenate dehydrogenase/arogenate dehydrogenase family protein [Puniceicoccales bacterium]|nr:prephenate dehydrogenase/arogenate dehydrogenase family protein [Puniceicoccales bacterium]